MEKYAKRIATVFNDRHVNDRTVRDLAFWTVYHLKPDLDMLVIYCHWLEREIELAMERDLEK